MKRLGFLIVAASMAGCGGPDVKDICEALAECPEPTPVGECIEQGEALEEAADDRSCDEPFEDYLDCLDGAGCDWEKACAAQVDALESCAGPLPPAT